jgi:hypothetical protein
MPMTDMQADFRLVVHRSTFGIRMLFPNANRKIFFPAAKTLQLGCLCFFSIMGFPFKNLGYGIQVWS